MENRKAIGKTNETTSQFFEKIHKIDKPLKTDKDQITKEDTNYQYEG